MEVVHRLATLVLLACVLLHRSVDASCGGGTTTYNGNTGVVKSVGYPNTDYVKGQTCRWKVYTFFSTKGIILEITDMDIYKSPTLDCSQADYLRIENTRDNTDVWADYLCGNTILNITGPSDAATIIFVASNTGTSGRGFSISWSVAPDTTTETTSTTAATTTRAPGLSQSNIIIIAVTGGGLLLLLLSTVIGYVAKNKQNRVETNNTKSVQPIQHRKAPTAYQQSPSTGTQQSFVPLTSSAWKPGVNLAPPPPQSRPAKQLKEEVKLALPHIMISYQWDAKPEVLEFRQKLADAGYRVWIDVEQMHKGTSTFGSMASAVDNSAVVVPVLTKKYQESINCRKEIEFADMRKKPLVPICMEKDYELAGWLEFLIGSSTKHILCDDDIYDEQLENFFSAIKVLAKSAREEDVEEGERE